MQALTSAKISTGVRVGLAVAVRTEHSQILQTVVVPDSVYVIEMHDNSLAAPLLKSALRAFFAEKTRPN
jgi:hypothetical protein